jgi:hypothetical protein
MSETPDQAATRRRWISLAEVVAVAGVVIAALSLYLSWADKREERAEKAAAVQQETRKAAVITLRATRAKGGERLEVADSAHPVDTVDIAFPTPLGVSAQTGLVKPVIDAKWIEGPVLDLDKSDKARGRVPVLITSTFWEGDTKYTAPAIYDVAWKADGGLFGRSLKLEGLSLRERGGSQARLDAIWKQIAPK